MLLKALFVFFLLNNADKAALFRTFAAIKKITG